MVPRGRLRQERLHLASQCFISGTDLRQERGTFVRSPHQCLVIARFDLPPAVGRHGSKRRHPPGVSERVASASFKRPDAYLWSGLEITRLVCQPWRDIFTNVFMPTTVHIPAVLLRLVDRRAKALGVSRNRLIVRALEQAVKHRSAWTPEFLERLRTVDRETREAVDELLVAVKQARRSTEPRDL